MKQQMIVWKCKYSFCSLVASLLRLILMFSEKQNFSPKLVDTKQRSGLRVCSTASL